MNITTIRSMFLALELGSISAAATQLGVPASTVSRRIQQLENEWNTRLVQRSGRGILPADEAKDILLKLREVLLAVEQCYAPESSITRLRVSSTLEMSVSILPRVIPKFQKMYPNVVVELLGENRITGLIEADFDLAIRTGSLSDLNLIGKQLPAGGFVLVASPKLAKKITSVQKLASIPSIEISGPPTGISGHWQGEPFNVRPPVIAKLNTFTAALPSLFAGVAFAQMPPHLVQEYLDSGQLTKISQAKLIDIPIHALYPKRHRNQAIVSAFIAEIEDILKI